MGKKTCEICDNDTYSGKYAQHLQKQHQKIWGMRHLIKNVIKNFSKEELEQVKELVLKIQQQKEPKTL